MAIRHSYSILPARKRQIMRSRDRCPKSTRRSGGYSPKACALRRTAPLIFAASKVNSVATHSVGTVRAAINSNLSCMFIPRCSGFTSYEVDGCRPNGLSVSCCTGSHRVAVSLTVCVSHSRECQSHCIIALYYRFVVGVYTAVSSLEWETYCCMLIANWTRECYRD